MHFCQSFFAKVYIFVVSMWQLLWFPKWTFMLYRMSYFIVKCTARSSSGVLPPVSLVKSHPSLLKLCTPKHCKSKIEYRLSYLFPYLLLWIIFWHHHGRRQGETLQFDVSLASKNVPGYHKWESNFYQK